MNIERLLLLSPSAGTNGVPALVAALLELGHIRRDLRFWIDLPNIDQATGALGDRIVVGMPRRIEPSVREALSLLGIPVRIRSADAVPTPPWGRLRRLRSGHLGPAARRRLDARRQARGEPPVSSRILSGDTAPKTPVIFLRSRSTHQIFPMALGRDLTSDALPSDHDLLDTPGSYPIGRWIPRFNL